MRIVILGFVVHSIGIVGVGSGSEMIQCVCSTGGIVIDESRLWGLVV